MKRTLTPEFLDSLPPNDPAARHSRRDLRLFHAVLGGARWLRRTVVARMRPGERALEIGAGTGELGASLARQGFALDGLDRGPCPSAWPAASRWHQTDVMAFDGWRQYEVVVGSLILHHFDTEGLQKLGRRMATNARLIVACEPTRRRHFQWFFAALCALIDANSVSRHDGRVSIEAGFLGEELPVLLGLNPGLWRWRVDITRRGMYQMVAERHSL